MKKILFSAAMLVMSASAIAQTLNVQVGNVTYQFPAAQTGQMTYTDGTSLSIMGKTFTLSEVSGMTIDDSTVNDDSVSVVYNGTSATVTVSGNIAQYLTITQSGAHVSIVQSDDVASEITYQLQGSTTDGGFYTEGSYKATVVLNGLTLTNTSATYSGAALHVQNGKRIKIKTVEGTTNTLVDAADGSQKGCIYVKGHAEFAQKGTLNVTGQAKHGIKTGEYMSLKKTTLNILSAAGDGINCAQYMLVESGSITISESGDDGIQCDIDDTDVGSTGETTDHEDEDSGNIYLNGGNVTVSTSATAAKGIKGEGNIYITDEAVVNVTTSGNGEWDSDDLETKAACGVSSDANIYITGGTITLTATGSGGKGLKCDSVLNISGGTMTIVTSGGLYYNNGTTENTNYTGDTDNVDSDYYSSPKGIKAGTKTEVSSNSYTYAGAVVISGGTINVTTSGQNAEGIESKNTFDVTGGYIYVDAHDDALNSAQDMTISGGYIYARAADNDGIDANGNCYISGGLIYAIGATSPEIAIDVNSEDQKQLYFTGGTLIALGGLESGASLSQTCYSASSWSANTWYALSAGDQAIAFLTPASIDGATLVVSAASAPTLYSGVTVQSGTEICNSKIFIDVSYNKTETVTLSNYSGGNSGPNGNNNQPGGDNNNNNNQPGGGGSTPGGF